MVGKEEGSAMTTAEWQEGVLHFFLVVAIIRFILFGGK